MPQVDRSNTAKKHTAFADDDFLDDIPSEMPQEAPTSGSDLAKGRTIGRGMPAAKVDTGDVAIHAPNVDIDMSKAPNPSTFLQQYDSDDPDMDTEEENPEPPPPVEETMPAILQNALSTEAGEVKSYQMANIVRSAPPQMQRQLQNVGKEIFSQHSATPKSLKDVYAVTSLTNSETEVKLMLAWIVMHGRKISDAEYSFPSMPGYKPKAELWEDEGARFLIVRETPKDFAGEEIEETFDDPDFEDKVDNKQCIFYIYGWGEVKDKIEGDGGLRADLLEVATSLARKHGAMTVREAYEELIEAYLFEEEVDYEVGRADREEIEKKWTRGPATQPTFSEKKS